MKGQGKVVWSQVLLSMLGRIGPVTEVAIYGPTVALAKTSR